MTKERAKELVRNCLMGMKPTDDERVEIITLKMQYSGKYSFYDICCAIAHDQLALLEKSEDK
jgi:hypothetical protein